MKNLLYSIVIGLLCYSNGLSQIKQPFRDIGNTPIKVTPLAACRMKCLKVTEEHTREVLREGKIDMKKSQPTQKPCPIYHVSDVTKDGQKMEFLVQSCKDYIRILSLNNPSKNANCDCKDKDKDKSEKKTN
ncbi:MAG: hypothetical protein NZ108_11130 [Bacteroidia bacterium]|nr:hypothetical protein [Bacteroidia bacterium]